MLVAEIFKEKDTNKYDLVVATWNNYSNIEELQVMNYKEAMEYVNYKEWDKAIKLKHKNMAEYNLFQVFKKEDVATETKLMNFTWVMKKKFSGLFQARLYIWGLQQNKREQYQSDNKLAPVVNRISINIVLVSIIVLEN